MSTGTDTAPLHPVSPHPVERRRSAAPDSLGKWADTRTDLDADHATVFHGHVRTATMLTVREALAAIATKIGRKMPGIAVHLYANDIGPTARCATHREFDCWYASDPEHRAECSITQEPATEITVSVTGAPVWDGEWRVAGTLTTDSLGVVTTTTFGMAEGWANEHRALAGQCAHCGKRRARAVTVLLADATGRPRPVGRSCLADYTGGTVRADLLTDLLALGERVQQAFGVIADAAPDSAPTVDVVAVAMLLVARHGFVRSGCRTEDDTRTRLRKILAPARGEPATDILAAELTAAERAAARAAIATVLADDSTSGYLNNLRAVVAGEWVQITGARSRLGLLASLPTAATRAREAELRRIEHERANAARLELPNDHIGKLGDKVELSGRVDTVKWTDGDYGSSLMVVIETPAGRVKMWTNTAGFDVLTAGQHATVRATVKRHGEFQGRRETIVTRPKLIEAAAAV